MKTIKKISVLGAGAIGTMFGGLIKHHYPHIEVVLICRGEHCRAMQERGFTELFGGWGCWEVPVTAASDSAAIADSDLILFTVKTQDTVATAEQFSECFGDAIIVSLQNGINQHLLAPFVRPDRLMVGMTATNMTITQPGVVTLHRKGTSVIGAASPAVSAAVVEQACDILSASGMTVKASNAILGVQYNKLLFNTMGYASVISASDFIREGLLDRGWRGGLAIPLLSEGMTVLKASGVPLVRASGVSDVIRLKRLMHVLGTPGLDCVARTILAKVSRLPRLVFSVYQDLVRHRPTEIDFVNGEIVRLAQANGIAAPYNSEVTRIVHQMEQQQPVQFWSHGEVVRHFCQMREL